METEQASGYDMVTANDFFNTLQLLSKAGMPPPPSYFAAHVEQMWDYGEALPSSNQTACQGRVLPDDWSWLVPPSLFTLPVLHTVSITRA